MNLAAYQRLIVGYHGCDERVAQNAIEKGEQLLPSQKDYDWLGSGIYFWEHGPERALAWAEERYKQGKLKKPAVVGALIQLGNCFDLLDTRYTSILGAAFEELNAKLQTEGGDFPHNSVGNDLLRRDRDCMLLNWLIPELEKNRNSPPFQTVRGLFQEGEAAFEGSGIRLKSHIQIAVRDPSCIIGYFRPISSVRRAQKAKSIEELWASTSKRLKKMTPAESRQSLIDAGILTKNGNVAAPYKRLLSPKKK